jgi:hypothetical protein
MVMATKQEVKKHLEIALKEIGEIKPWFDDEVNEWVFSHPNYPVEYGGETAKEVIKNYPKYLREFITHRLNDNLNPRTEKKTKGHGGKRTGSGRPKGTVKEPTKRIALPIDIAAWISQPESIERVRKLMRR